MTPFRWDDHGNSIMEKVADFYRNHEYTDCVFVVDGDKIRGHRVILRSASKYFERILESETGEEEIPMKNMKFCDLKYAFDFIYFGKVEVPENQLASFIETAVLLQISGLVKETCEVQIIATVESVRSDFSPSSNLHCVGKDSGIEGTGNVLEIINMEDTFLEEEVPNIREILGDECSDEETNIHSDLDLRGDDHLNEPAFFFCDKSQQSSFNNEVVKGENIELCRDPLFLSKEDLKIEKEIKTETVSCHPVVAKQIAESQCPVEENTTEVYDDSLFHSEVDIKSEDDCARGSQTSLPSDDERDNKSGDATCKGRIIDLGAKLGLPGKNGALNSNYFSDYSPKMEDSNSPVSKETIERSFFCNECNAAFSQKGLLKIHVQKHTGEKRYHCKFCTSTFSDLSNLKRHKRKHSGEKPYACDICSFSCSELSNLKTHKRTHSGEKPYACDICSSSFSQLSSLQTHKRTHTGEKPYLCDICFSSFSHLGNFNVHKRTHSGEKPYVCDICSSSFSQSSYLKSHKRTHSGEKPYYCDICSYSFSALTSLKTHKRIHTGEKPYVCEICSFSFSRLDNLKSHKRTHSGEKPYRCEICSSSYSHLNSLKAHRRTHSGEKPYSCDICSSSFSHLNSLKAHMRYHLGEKTYSCDICSSSFSALTSLKTHKRIHTGEKPYVCEICSFSFSRLDHLKSHKRTHSGEKPYRCEICSSSFSHLNSLKAHKRTHLGEKPYSCDICFSSFSQLSERNAHKRTHSGEQLFCDLSSSAFSKPGSVKTKNTHW